MGREQSKRAWRPIPLRSTAGDIGSGSAASWHGIVAAVLMAATGCASGATTSAIDPPIRYHRRTVEAGGGSEPSLASNEVSAASEAPPGDALGRAPPPCAESCASDGHCVLVGRYCQPTHDHHCLQSRACREHGACSLVGTRCLARRDEDCARSTLCIERDRCVAFAGECWVRGRSREACDRPRGTAQVNPCAQLGQCTPSAGGLCSVGSTEDCRASALCREEGLCTDFTNMTLGGVPLGLPFCGAAGRDCQGSEACRLEGRCTSWGSGCRRSCEEVCKYGFCREEDGECTR